MYLLEIIFWCLATIFSAIADYFLIINTAWYFGFFILLFIPIAMCLIWLFYIIFLFLWGKCMKTNYVVDKPNPFYYSVIRQTAASFCHFIQVRWKINGLEKLPKDRKFVIYNNHVSNFDQIVEISALPKKYGMLVCVSKPENMNFFIAGPFIHHAGFIPINREDPRKGVKAIRKAADFIQNDYCNIGISPEGTRNKTDAPLLPFHPGSFKLASWADAPIVIVCLKHTQDVKKRAPWRLTVCEMDILEVLYPEDYENMDTPEIAKHAEDIILADLQKEGK